MRSDSLRATAGLTAGILLIAFAWATAASQAATYTVWSCRGPDGKPVSTQAWLAGDDSAATADTCSDGGALRAQLLPSDNTSGIVRGHRFVAPPATTIAGYRVHLFAMTAKSELLEPLDARPESGGGLQAGLDTDPGLAVTEIDEGCLTSGCVYGVPDVPLDPANLLAGSDPKSDALVVAARCGGLFGCLGQGGAEALAEVRLFRSEIEIRDGAPPDVAAAGGTLVTAAEAVTGKATIGAEVTDAGGGVASVALLIDGAPVDLWRAACSEPYTAPRPCPEQVGATFAVDATALAAGPHGAALRATDAAGNVTTGEVVPFTVAVPLPPPPPPPAPAPPEPTVIERAVPTPVAVPVEPRRVAVRATRGRVDLAGGNARVIGGVRLADGSPAAGARVIVRSHPLGVRRSPWRVERRLTADETGRFTMAAGPVSRLLQLDVDDRDHRAVRPAEVELLNRLRVRVARSGSGLRNGSLMRLRVDVDGAGRGSSGKVALVQAVVGRRWATVDSLTLDSAGRAVWRYRFRGTTRRAVYRFRVRVERAGDAWPWPTTDSRVLRVPVRP